MTDWNDDNFRTFGKTEAPSIGFCVLGVGHVRADYEPASKAVWLIVSNTWITGTLGLYRRLEKGVLLGSARKADKWLSARRRGHELTGCNLMISAWKDSR